MNAYTVKGLTPFIPSRDYALSKAFYEDLGFSRKAGIEKATLYEADGFGFWVQDYYVNELAENCMLCLYVDDIDAWWSQARKVIEGEKYKAHVKVFTEPHDQEGARMMQFLDPTGVLWHIREQR